VGKIASNQQRNKRAIKGDIVVLGARLRFQLRRGRAGDFGFGISEAGPALRYVSDCGLKEEIASLSPSPLRGYGGQVARNDPASSKDYVVASREGGVDSIVIEGVIAGGVWGVAELSPAAHLHIV